MRIQYLSILILALCIERADSQSSQPRYAVIDLGTLGGPRSLAIALNNSGVVVGTSTTARAPDVDRAFRWTNGVMIDIGDLGGPSATAGDINDAGQIAGSSETFDSLPTYQTWHAFRWDNGTMTDLGTTGGHDSHGGSINSSGVIVGRSMICWFDPKYPGQPCFPVGNEYAARWIGNTGTDLGGLGGADSEAYGINASGVIAGQANLPSGQQNRRATCWINGQALNLGSLGGTGFNSWALDISDHNVITGFSDTLDNLHHHSFLYDLAVGAMIDIGAPPGHADSEAWAINNAGHVVGQTGSEIVFGGTDGFLYDGTSMVDLNNVIPANSGWHLVWAFDINDHDWIVGYGLHNNQQRGYLLVPIGPCPADIAPLPDGNGTVNIDDLLLVINSWGMTGLMPADINHDLLVNIDDLLMVINTWGTCP
jgi:probable HAF family extracellular repeat protein